MIHRCLQLPHRVRGIKLGLNFSNAGERSLSYRIGGNGNNGTSGNSNVWLYGIIAANSGVYIVWELSKDDRRKLEFMGRNFTLSSYGVLKRHDYHTLITAIFSHYDIYHFGFNMLALYSFGINTLQTIGTSRFGLLYFGGGLLSSIGVVLWPLMVPSDWPAARYESARKPALGASGAIYAVVCWNILTFPKSLIYFYGIIPIPAAFLGIGLIGYDMYNLYRGDTQTSNVGHLGGAAFGTLFYLINLRRGRGRW
eukprot:gene8958-12079_t